MSGRATRLTFAIDGMTCGSCEARIERALAGLDGVLGVKASAPLGEAEVSFDPSRVDTAAIETAIRGAGYAVRPGPARARAGGVLPFLGLLAVVAGVYLALRFTVGFSFLPTVSQSMGYWLIFLVGLVTSVHCLAMCGGIVLSQGISRGGCDDGADRPPAPRRAGERLAPTLSYNAGRVLSYTVIGGIVGGLGSLFSLSTALKGAIPVIAGAFMVFLGIRMLGIFPRLSRLRIRIPGLGGRRLSTAAARRGPFVVGILSGLMPCGPLQMMQVYALGTGSVLAGAFSMFLFSVGTVPLLLGFAAVSSFLSASFSRKMAKASGVLVALLGLVMLGRGFSLFGVALPRLAADADAAPVAAARQGGAAVASGAGGYAVGRLSGSVQEVTTRVLSSSYQPFVVQQGIPVRWTLEVEAGDLNGCNGTIVVPAFGIRRKLAYGKNVVEFTPDRAGTLAYTCWMGMISSTIRVVPDLAGLPTSDPQAADASPAGRAAIAAGLATSGGATAGATAGAACSCCVSP
ncbi:MAG: sulfite exporter TauE/SafE family protein [Spirochaetes bacterium]|nr:sulfite exporter TauE/SafE family protein [Spirochaetota bacterium]